jgi:hypothetical protein
MHGERPEQQRGRLVPAEMCQSLTVPTTRPLSVFAE